MGIRPNNIQAYLFYDCSKCGAPHEDLRLGEAKDRTHLTCGYCGHRDKLEPVEGIEVKYKQTRPQGSKQVTCHIMNDDVKQAKKTLVQLGYTGNQAKLVVQRTISLHSPASYDDLVKLALIEAANVYSPTNSVG
jgi:DNA-directed RNA polymerase subunit RPC12/RpoP